MNIQLHQNARTTPAIRLELQAQPQSVSNLALAEVYHLNRHTVAKWRQREEGRKMLRITPNGATLPSMQHRKRGWWRCVRPSCCPWMTCWR